ncbi:MAG: aspartate--tRNA(Asn) ligase, partial [Candidatus Lokiarchaeota archaeon]|nr:aspartate--tRNA(Asn) ligase [Candidatus Lokiarchaeota archaeon]MBD3200853.1 aspartate--tRNA(Asn) ligase [Candidatus Lokiarchaeota archaeon]
MLDDLGKFRKTHYTKEVSSEMEGEEIILGGWVRNYRDLGGLKFISLQDKFGERQITLKKGVVSDSIFEKAQLGYQDCIMVKGNVKAFNKAPGGVEIIPTEIKILNTTPEKLPIDMTGETVSELDLRLNNRALDLRSLRNQAIFEIRGEVLKSIRNFLYDHDFTEITTPKIIGSATEGGTELFPIMYFEKEAFLTQSAQLYKEQLSGVYERVFEISPCFRAEKSRTKRHLCEIFVLDLEMAFADMSDVLKVLEELIHNVISNITENKMEALKILKMEEKTLIPEIPFPRYTYEEIIELINNKFHIEIEFGEDISTEAYRKLGEELTGYYYITHWPMSVKPFYIMPSEDPKYSESFDLQMGWLELTSGGTRVHKRKMLEDALKAKGLNPRAFESHLKVFDYGMPPHAGVGLGIARWVTFLCGLDDIRESVMYP